MISKDKQYRTRDGREVRIYATDHIGVYPAMGAIKTEKGWIHNYWHLDGKDGVDETNDLIEIRPRIKREYWMNIYEDRMHDYNVYGSKETADRLQAGYVKRIACVKVVIDCEEGEGL